jgi:acyl-CoA thioester hydrolase
MSSRAATSTVRVRYAETDAMGVAYYANYLVWFEVARTDLLRSLGWSYREMEAGGVLLPVIEASCQYRHPARYDDELDIRTEGRVTSPIRMEFTYEVVLRGRQGPIATGQTVHVALGKSGRPCRLPHQITGAFA